MAVNLYFSMSYLGKPLTSGLFVAGKIQIFVAALLALLFGAGAELGAAHAPGGNKAAPEQNSADPLSSVVRIRAQILPDARTAATLGTSREGTGVVIDDKGLVLTIGYLVLEAAGIEVTGADGRTAPAQLVGYDFATGFGLVRSAWMPAAKAIELGDSSLLNETDLVLIATPDAISLAYVASRRMFAGYWEYLLERAIFTAPPRLDFGGAALIGRDGRLLGIGSLLVGDAAAPQIRSPGNMFVPIDLLKPILPDLIAQGRPKAPARPWLGVNLLEVEGQLVVTRVSPESPADEAGLRAGDIVAGIGADPVADLADFYRKVWARGTAGTEVPLKVVRDSRAREVTVRSIDRQQFLRVRPTY
jgi:serine protease Do